MLPVFTIRIPNTPFRFTHGTPSLGRDLHHLDSTLWLLNICIWIWWLSSSLLLLQIGSHGTPWRLNTAERLLMAKGDEGDGFRPVCSLRGPCEVDIAE